MLAVLREHPGASVPQVARYAGVHVRVAMHHLRVLEAVGLIRVQVEWTERVAGRDREYRSYWLKAVEKRNE